MVTFVCDFVQVVDFHHASAYIWNLPISPTYPVKRIAALLLLLLLALAHRGRQIPAVPAWPRDSLLPAGIHYQTVGRFDSARYFFKLAEDSLAQNPSGAKAEQLFYAEAMLFLETGHYTQSLPYFEKAIAALLQNSGPDDPRIVPYKSNYASALRKLHRYKEAMAIYEGLLVYNINVNELRYQMASMLIATGQYWLAVRYLHNVYYEPNSIGNLHKKYNSLAQCYLIIGNTDSTAYNLYVADSLHAKTDTTIRSVTYGLTQKYRGDWYRKKGDYAHALQAYQGAIVELIPSYNNTDPYSNPDTLAGIAAPVDLLHVLQAKAATLDERYQQTKDPKELAASLQTSLLMYRLGHYVANNFAADEARSLTGNQAFSSHRQSIGLCLKLYQATHDSCYLKQAFLFDEQRKAGAITDTTLVENDNISDSQLITAVNYKESITRLAMRTAGATDSASLIAGQQQQRNAEMELAKLQLRLQDARGNRRLAGSDIDLARLRQYIIPRGSAILSYYTGDSLLVGFLITRDTFDHFIVPLSDSFFLHLKHLQNDLRVAQGISNKTIGRQSNYLYRYLVQPVQQKIDAYEKLMIIPDDTLRSIPFELLQDSMGNYLLSRYSIQYNISCSVLKEAGKQPCATRLIIDDQGDAETVKPASGAAGCYNTIYAFWKNDTAATSFIVSKLRHYIKHEFPAAQALQKAKLDYLREPTIEGRFKTPAYWASLGLTGQFETAPEVANWWNYVLPGALTLIVLIVTIGFRRSRRHGHALHEIA